MASQSSQHTNVYCSAFFGKKEGGLFVSSDALSFQSDDGSRSKTWPWKDLSRITANKAGTSAKNLLRIDLKTSATNEGKPKPQVIEFESRQTLDEAKEDCLNRIQILPPGTGPPARNSLILKKPDPPAKKILDTTPRAQPPSKAKPKSKPQPNKAKPLAADIPQLDPSSYHSDNPTPTFGSKDSDSDSDKSDATPKDQMEQGQETYEDDVQFTPTKLEQESPRRNIETVKFNPQVIGLPDLMDQSSSPPRMNMTQQQQQGQEDVQFIPTMSEEQSPRRNIETLQIDPKAIGLVDIMDQANNESIHSSSAQNNPILAIQDDKEDDSDENWNSSSSSESFSSDDEPPKTKPSFPSNDQRNSNRHKEFSQPQTQQPQQQSVLSNKQDDGSKDISSPLEAVHHDKTVEMIDSNNNKENDDDKNDVIRPCQGCRLEYTLGAICILLCLILTPIIIWLMIRGLHSGNNGSSSSGGGSDDEYYNIDAEGALINYRYLRGRL